MKLLVLLSFMALASCTKSTTTDTPIPAATPVPAATATPAGTVLDPTPAPVATATPVVTAACALETSLVNAMATGLASIGNCKGVTAMESDFMVGAQKIGLCKAQASYKKLKTEKGTIGDIACPIVVNALGLSALSTVPATWQCDGGFTLASAEAQLTDLCTKNISF